MTTPVIETLAWDSARLNIPTARISALCTQLPDALSKAQSTGAHLVYWATDNTPENLNAAKDYNGILVDHKITYALSLNHLSAHSAILPTGEFYRETTVTPDLLHLAYESGKYSRFRKDPHLTEQQFEAVYQEWIKNSVNHSIAKEILVITEHSSILGMATLGEKNHRGDIGLLAVHENARGKKIGSALVQSALHYFKNQHYDMAQVVTQQDNIAACKLYEKCGFAVEKLELFFHFWV